MALTRPITALVLGLGLLSCGSDQTPPTGAAPPKGKRAGACAGPDFGPAAYGPSVSPTVDPSALAGPLPFPLTGADAGLQSVTYSAALMGYYMLGVQRPAGCVDDAGKPCMPFVYEYDPRAHAATSEEMIHRQVVGALGLAWLYKVTGRPEFGRSVRAAADLLLPRVKAQNGGGAVLADLGGTALMSMTLSLLAEADQDRSYDAPLASFGEAILKAQRPDGGFRSGSPLQWMQLHNALWRLHIHTGDPAYLEALRAAGKNAASRIQETGKGQYFEYPYLYGLWAIEPLTELVARHPEDAAWASPLVWLVADGLAADQYTAKNTKTCAWVGGFKPNNGKGPPSWNHVIKLEAMADATRYAQQVGDTARAEKYRKSAELGAFFTINFQHRAGETDAYPVPAQAIGGVPLYMDNPNVRIDIPGHGAVAMLKVATYLGKETVERVPTPPAAPTAAPAAPPASATPPGGAPVAGP